MAVGYQSFYQAQLTSPISDTDLTIPLDEAPIPDSGFLVIESTVASKREIIYYTSKTTNSVTCPADGRGYDGTTAVSHLSGAVVIMAPVGAMFKELRDQFTTSPQGWTSIVPAVSTVTPNGNRSYDVVFASTVASILSEGMRLEFTKATAGNAYMGGAFNGSSHYFTKTSPSGTLGTVTNNFTIEAVVQPTSYAQGGICGRVDASFNNAISLRMEASGVVRVTITNGGGSNLRYVETYQSLPLNKKTHVAASWTSGTVVVYFDGVSVPVTTASTSGSAPTTAGTGGDWSIGRNGAFAGQYFPGYISNVAVFDAVLSASTIKDHYTKKLTGSETNCIGAWSLDNSSSDQSSAGNNLTATGGVGYTAMSPHGQLGNGVETTKAVGLVTKVNGTTVTVQCPEGVTIPSGSSTISSVAYSTQANPFGWVSNKGRWIVGTYVGAQSQVTLTSNTTWYHLNQSLNVPIGKWMLGFQLAINYAHAGATYLGGPVTLSNANNTESDKRFTYYCTPGSNVSTTSNSGQGNRVNDISLTSATTFYVNTKPTNNNSTATFDVTGVSLIFATPSCL